MDKYRCVKEMSIGLVDDDGSSTDGFLHVEVDSIWERDDTGYRVVGDADSVRLDEVNDTKWIEISEEMLSEHFEIENIAIW